MLRSGTNKSNTVFNLLSEFYTRKYSNAVTFTWTIKPDTL